MASILNLQLRRSSPHPRFVDDKLEKSKKDKKEKEKKDKKDKKDEKKEKSKKLKDKRDASRPMEKEKFTIRYTHMRI